MTYAIIVAGGQGRRMGAAEPKQYLELDGVPIVVRTLLIFQQSGLFEKVILVLPEHDTELRGAGIRSHASLETLEFVAGGATRQASVYNALNALKPFAEDDDIICIHDAVRPLVDVVQVKACIEAAGKYGAAVLGLPVNETVKRCDAAGRILETVPRDGLWLARTPQTARFGLLWQAHMAAFAGGVSATDDAVLLEYRNIPVYMVKGSADNIKITEPDDLLLAKKLLR